MSDGIHIPDAWLRTTPSVLSDQGSRTAAALRSVAAQFEVETNPRYTPDKLGNNETYCNIYLWDVTRAMGAEIPHWVGTDGSPVLPGNGTELSANLVVQWLKDHGPTFGWLPCDKDTAIAQANGGLPTVAVWPNPGGIGHVAVVLAGGTPGVMRIAQAGKTNFFDGPVERGFGDRSLLYYTHP